MPAASSKSKPAAAEILRSDAQVKVVFSGRRFGKTLWMLTAGIEKCLSNPGVKAFIWLQAANRERVLLCAT